jgi:uncharacterized protein
VKYVLYYDSADNVAELAPVYFPAHRARWSEYHQDGTLLMIGPFSDGRAAMGVFTTREAAEEFAKGDPFVLHGVVKDWHVREWHEALAEP